MMIVGDEVAKFFAEKEYPCLYRTLEIDQTTTNLLNNTFLFLLKRKSKFSKTKNPFKSHFALYFTFVICYNYTINFLYLEEL